MRLSHVNLILILGGLVFLSACSTPKAGSTPLPEARIEDAWARPGTAGQNSAIYFTINNSNGPADQLLGVTGDIAESLELHRSMMDENGVMSMEQQPQVDIPAGGEVAFKPGDYHVMLVNLKQDLKLGDTFQIVLEFKNAGKRTVTVKVSE